MSLILQNVLSRGRMADGSQCQELGSDEGRTRKGLASGRKDRNVIGRTNRNSPPTTTGTGECFTQRRIRIDGNINSFARYWIEDLEGSCALQAR
jgi:hypothetical protein